MVCRPITSYFSWIALGHKHADSLSSPIFFLLNDCEHKVVILVEQVIKTMASSKAFCHFLRHINRRLEESYEALQAEV